MKVPNWVVVLSISFSPLVAKGQALVCDQTLYLSQSNTAQDPTTLYEINTTPNPFQFNATGNNTHGIVYNALAYNPQDDFLYAMRYEANLRNQLVRIDNNGVPAVVGAISGIPINQQLYGGEIDSSGNYYVKPSGNNNALYQINITNQTATAITLSQNVRLPDMAFSNGLLWGIDNNTSRLVSINPNTGQVNPATNPLSFTKTTSFGAMYSSSDGSIYANYNAGLSDPNNGFYQFNTNTGEETLISKTQGASVNDGAHCINSTITFSSDLVITKTDNATIYTPGNTIVYTIVVTNNGAYGVVGANVMDSFPVDIPQSNVSYVANPSPGSSSSVNGIQQGDINDIVSLPVNGSITYTVTVNVPTNFTGNLVNTATVVLPANRFDPNSANNSATDINVMNNIPVADDDTNSTPEDTTLTVDVTNGLLSNDRDDDGDALTVTGATIVVNGTPINITPGTMATLPGTGSITINADGSYTFDPEPNFNGSVPPITYTISDGNGGTDTANLNLTVDILTDADTLQPVPSSNIFSLLLLGVLLVIGKLRYVRKFIS